MNDVIRVAHVIGCVSKGGVESVVFNYYKFIDKTKFQFDFIIDEGSPCEIPEEILNLGCKVYKIHSYTKLPAYIKALKKIFIQGNYKIVHSHMNTLSVFTLFAAKQANVPVRIAHSHSTAGKGEGEFARNLMKYSLRPFAKLYPTHLFACSEYAGRWLFGNKAFNKRKVAVFNNAIDASKFVYNEEIRNKVRNGLGINKKFVVGHVGRFVTAKNHNFLLDIFNEVHKKNKNSILLLIGDGELKNNIERKVNNLNLQDNVIFLGNRNDVSELYQAMDVFVLPSLYEGFGMVAVEAQFAALPTIVSTKVAIETKLTNFVDFLNLSYKAEMWAENILSKQFYKRIDISEEMGMSNFVINNEAGNLEKVYEKLI